MESPENISKINKVEKDSLVIFDNRLKVELKVYKPEFFLCLIVKFSETW